MADRTVSVALVAKVQGFVAGVGTAARATKQFGGELDRLGKESPKRFNDLTMAMAGAGVGLAGIALGAAKVAADFDKQMSHVNAVANASSGELDRLRSAALAAGKATSFSATEAAKAEEELSKAGISTADILGGALNGSLALAAAGSLDLAEAADIAAKAMNTFQLSGKDVGHIADVLSASANKSATDVHEMGEALKMGGLAARNSGLSLEQTVGVLSAFADRALVGSDAGTSLKTMLQFLANPTEKASNLMRQLGIDVYDSAGNFVGITKVADILQEKLGTLTQEERNAALATIFGADATRAATVLYELGAQGVQKYVDAVDDSGAAADTAQKKTDNLAGDLERLRGTLETLAIDAGSGASGGLRKLVQLLDQVAGSFMTLPGGIQSTLVMMAGLGGAALLASAGWLKLRERVREAQEALIATGPAGARAASGLGAVMSFAGKLALTLTALQLASAALGTDVGASMDGLTKSLADFGKTGQAAGEMARLFHKDLGLLAEDLQILRSGWWDKAGNGFAEFVEGLTGSGQVFEDSITKGRVRIGELDQALTQLVSSGHAEDAAAAFNRIAEMAKKQGVSVEDLRKALPSYSATLDGASASEQNATNAASQHRLQNDLLTGSLKGAIDAAGSLKAVFDQLNGAQLSVNESTIAAEAAVDDLTESFEKNGRSLDVTTAAGRANLGALDQLAVKAAEAAEAVYEQTGSVDQANATFQRYRDQLISTLVAMGKTRAEAEALANQLMSLPKNIPINVNVTTHYRTDGTPSQGNSRYPGINSARGNILEAYGEGGEHVGQMAPAGAMRLWAEPETGGEGYIPLSAAKRNRSIQILKTINQRFGSPIGGGSSQPVAVSFAFTGNTRDALAQVIQQMFYDQRIQVYANGQRVQAQRG